jgi:hypothetical protein
MKNENEKNKVVGTTGEQLEAKSESRNRKAEMAGPIPNNTRLSID